VELAKSSLEKELTYAKEKILKQDDEIKDLT
jgi:hypothetical protein